MFCFEVVLVVGPLWRIESGIERRTTTVMSRVLCPPFQRRWLKHKQFDLGEVTDRPCGRETFVSPPRGDSLARGPGFLTTIL